VDFRSSLVKRLEGGEGKRGNGGKTGEKDTGRKWSGREKKKKTLHPLI